MKLRAYIAIQTVVILFLCVNCVTEVTPPSVAQEPTFNPLPVFDDNEDEQGGGEDNVLHLPRPEGDSLQCTQGVNGSTSHQGPATRYDLDFDTPNDRDEALFAPCSGTARVHTENPEVNFGNHVNVDRGDGTYCLLGHLERVVVRDGDEVVAGQLIGIEGCTGLCTGDHVHVGLHRGDATQPAEFGISIPASYVVDGELGSVQAEAFACGIPAARTYRSALAVALAYPDGTLVKSPMEAKVYLVENGALRWIVDEEAFLSRGWDFREVVVVPDEALDCYAQGNDIVGEGTPPGAGPLPNGALVRETSRSDVYAVEDGVARPIVDGNMFHLMGFGSRTVQFIPDGTLAERVSGIGSCQSGIGCIDRAYTTSCRADNTGGSIGDEPVNLDALLDLDGGEFGMAYAPPANHPVEHVLVYMMVNGADGSVHIPWDLAVFQEVQGAVFAKLPSLEPGDQVVFRVDVGNTADSGDSCSVPGGDMLVRYDTEDLEPIVVTAPDTGCAHLVTIPGISEFDPEPEQEEEEGCFDPGCNNDPDITPPPPEPAHRLTMSWSTPFIDEAERITLSGEYRFVDGSYGFVWNELKTVEDETFITYAVNDVRSGDTFRFSVEYEDADGDVSWSCIGPFVSGSSQQGTLQGRPHAAIDGQTITIHTIGDPSGETTGCGLILTIP